MEEEDTRPSEDETSDTDGNESSEQDVELMVTTRERRATAGNRYNSLVAQEQAIEDEEDEVALLFAEGEEEDDEFNSDAGADDADMSSSDDDDQGPEAGAEDLDGEKEIQQQAKAEKVKKRKADLALTSIAGIRKKPKIDPTTLHKPAIPKPTKKKERVSWIPEQGLEKGRTSLRAQTIAHRAETHAKLKVNEEQRLRMRAIRQQREKQREADAPKELTQADRLAEAERIERKNAKSLNRWETMEKKRAEEQAAKLAALKDRKLHGAVVTWHSSSAKYFGHKNEENSTETTTIEVKKRGRKPKAFHEQMAAAKLANENSVTNLQPQIQMSTPLENNDKPVVPVTQSRELSISESTAVTSPTSKSAEESFLTGIHEYASMVAVDQVSDSKSDIQMQEADVAASDIGTDSKSQIVSVEPRQNSLPLRSTMPTSESKLQATEDSNGDQATPEVSSILAGATELVSQPTLKTDGNISTSITQFEPNIMPSSVTNPETQQPQSTEPIIPSPPPSSPKIEIISTRNIIILENFDNLSNQERINLNLFYNTRTKTANKPTKHIPELCPITGLPARYRDPITGIGYANVTAYKKLQDLRKHVCNWSGMLGCYVGRAGLVARGVPEGFLVGR